MKAIVEIELPRNCMECAVSRNSSYLTRYKVCGVTGDNVACETKSRPSNCPLKIIEDNNGNN